MSVAILYGPEDVGIPRTIFGWYKLLIMINLIAYNYTMGHIHIWGMFFHCLMRTSAYTYNECLVQLQPQFRVWIILVHLTHDAIISQPISHWGPMWYIQNVIMRMTTYMVTSIFWKRYTQGNHQWYKSFIRLLIWMGNWYEWELSLLRGQRQVHSRHDLYFSISNRFRLASFL